jgi:hypothetical protein
VIYQETRPLVGQSPHILNLSVGFNKESWGTYAEVSYGFTGKRLALVSAFEGFDYFQNPLSELAISFNQRITERLKFFGAFTNLLNAPYELVLDDGKLIEHETYRASFELGIKYKL